MSFNLSGIIKGIIAGFIGTLVLTGLMMMKKYVGIMPSLDPVQMITNMVAEKTGTQTNMMVGWVLHFVIGSVAWGVAFSVINDLLPSNSQVVKGVIFGVGAWLLMMIGPMPISGAGLFGLSMGIMAPVLTLVLHIAFGATMGLTFAKLKSTHSSTL